MLAIRNHVTGNAEIPIERYDRYKAELRDLEEEVVVLRRENEKLLEIVRGFVAENDVEYRNSETLRQNKKALLLLRQQVNLLERVLE